MLEVINGFLLVYFIVLCSLNILVPYFVSPIAACFGKPSHEDRIMWAEIVKLKDEQKAISMKDEFAAFSKLQRKIVKLENQLKDNSQYRRNKAIAIKSTITMILNAVIAFVIITSVIWFRREPIVTLKGNLFPFTNILKYPSDLPNAVSTHMWVVISNVSIRSLIKPMFS